MRKLGDEKVGLPTLTCRLWGPEQVVFVLFCFLQEQMYSQILTLFVKNRGHGYIILLEMFWYAVSYFKYIS